MPLRFFSWALLSKWFLFDFYSVHVWFLLSSRLLSIPFWSLPPVTVHFVACLPVSCCFNVLNVLVFTLPEEDSLVENSRYFYFTLLCACFILWIYAVLSTLSFLNLWSQPLAVPVADVLNLEFSFDCKPVYRFSCFCTIIYVCTPFWICSLPVDFFVTGTIEDWISVFCRLLHYSSLWLFHAKVISLLVYVYFIPLSLPS